MRTLGRLVARLGRYALDMRSGDFGRHAAAREIIGNRTLPGEELRKIQFGRLAAIVDYAYNHCSWYRKQYDAVGFKPGDLKDFADLKNLPVLSKTAMREDQPGLLSDAVPESERRYGESGGTTGTPIRFYRSVDSQAYRRGIDLALLQYYGWRPGDWQGALWAAPRDVAADYSLKARLRNRLFDRRYNVDSWDLSDRSYEEFVTKTKKLRPRVISAFPSMACDLADRMEAGRVSRFRVPVVSVSAEPFYEHQREKIKAAFGDWVCSRYGAREFGTAAFECPHQDGLHIFMESVYIETVAAEGVEGDGGIVLVTDLLNHAMPLIRYRVGDFGVMMPDDSVCSCGLESQRIKDIVGRDTDIIWLPDGTGMAGANLIIISTDSKIDVRVQFVQKRLDHILVRVEGKLSDYEAMLDRFLHNLHERVGHGVHFTLEGVDTIERSPSGKFQFVLSELTDRATPKPGRETGE